MQNVVRYQRDQLTSNNKFLLPGFDAAREGVTRPLWIDSKLLLARRVVADGQVRIQGSWLDWPAIRDLLKGEVSDLFPQIELLPVTFETPVAPDRRMATLPVQLSVPDALLPDPLADYETLAGRFSAIQISLFVAWCCLALASGAVAIMLQSVLKLSERRAAFVSAVTHELRSPLTTFRMYAEMLADGMIRDDQQRAVYYDTLRLEADRLAPSGGQRAPIRATRTSRHPRRRAVVDLAELIHLATQRLSQRASQSGMEVQQTVPPHSDGKSALTDPAAVEQILFNLVDNACKYASSARDRRIHVVWSWGRRRVRVRVSDHGPGIPAADRGSCFGRSARVTGKPLSRHPASGWGWPCVTVWHRIFVVGSFTKPRPARAPRSCSKYPSWTVPREPPRCSRQIDSNQRECGSRRAGRNGWGTLIPIANGDRPELGQLQTGFSATECYCKRRGTPCKIATLVSQNPVSSGAPRP